MIELPKEVARAGWIIDSEQICHATVLLNIQLDVRIKLMTSTDTWATHRVIHNADRTSLLHHITIHQNRTIEQTNLSLWHELAHCHQVERWAKQFNESPYWFRTKAYAIYGAHGQQYKDNPFEAHARVVADKFAKLHNLVKEANTK